LLENFAAQAVIAMENARLITETREALEQQTATAEVLQTINSSPGDLTPVFEAILEKAHALCGAAFGSLLIFDGERFRFAAHRNVPAAYAEYRERNPQKPMPGSGPFRLLQTKRPIQDLDIRSTEGYQAGHADARAMVELGGIRTIAGVPLLKDDALLGVITIYRQEVRPFSDKQIALLENFAEQAVVAMENARLLTETREALDQQTATAEVLQVINSSPGNLDRVFDAMLEKAMRLCGAAFGSLYVLEGERLRSVAQRGVPEAYANYRATNPPSPTGAVLAELIQSKRPIHILDMKDHERYRASYPDARAMVDLAGARTTILVPLIRDETFLGYISVFRQEIRAFSDKQIALLQNFAAQAVFAMENARLLTETREALEQQTATAEVLQVINASPGDLTPVFDALLDKAVDLCGAAFGILLTYDGKRFRHGAFHSIPAAYIEYMREHPPVYGPESAPGRLALGERLVHTLDITDTDAYRSGEVNRRAIADLAGARTLVAVALQKDGALIGAIVVFRQQVRAFSDKQIALLENFAAQGVIAMENARLINETHEALEQQTATSEVLQVINSSPGDLAPVFEALLEKAMRLCGAAFGSLYTYDGERFHSAAQRGVPPAYAAYRAEHPPLLSTPGGAPAVLLETGRPVHVLDMRAHETNRPDFPNVRAMVELGGIRTSLAVPLIKDDAFLGFITIYRQEVRAFSDKQIALLESFAAQAVIAMENARLLTEQREALEQQTATAELLQVINSSPGDLAPVFNAILEKAHTLCGVALGALVLFDGEHYRGVATHGMPGPFDELVRQPRRPWTGSIPDRFLKGERLIQVSDLAHFEATASAPGHVMQQARLAVAAGGRTLLAVPLRKDARLLGYITAHRREVRLFSEKEVTLLESFAAQAVIAMENARLLNEVRQRQEELRITFENMGDGVALFDEAPRLVAWNQHFQEMFNLPDDLLEQHRTYEEHLRFLAERGDFGLGLDAEEQLRALVTNIDKPRVYERTRPDGRVLEIRRNPVPSGGFVLIFSDITVRKQNEAEIRAARDAAEEASRTIEAAYRDLKAAQASLIQAEKMASLGQLTAGIAHEIKNPLNFVNNFAGLSVELLEELKETAAPGFAMLDETRRAEIDDLTRTLSGNLEKINEHGNRADGIVRSMLEHSRGSSGERRSVNLNTLVDEALNLAYHGARAQDQSFTIALERDFDQGITPITLVPQDITRVLLNLFSNGFYAAHRRQSMEGEFEPSLKAATRELGEAVEIRVRDNGIGIPEEVRDKLFQPFFTTKPTGEGTGLGLSISYDIVTQQHGGSITVDSKVGEYSEFTICLPRK
jgi:GAF domain-containing protein/nitrogen-specific signal transduction histidine kinase